MSTWRHFSDRTVKTRKEHECLLCGQVIQPFTQAVRRRGSMDGKLQSFMMHMDCEEVASDWDEQDWIMNDPGSFAHEMEERRSQK